MDERVCAIHQPNFFPWLGYFDKINKSDVFILMDNVQFPKTGGVWTNRVKIAVGGEPHWLTVPIERNYHGVRMIRDMRINDATSWREKMLRTIELNYRRSRFFDDEWPFVSGLINYRTPNLCDFNVHAITALMNCLGLDTGKLVMGSTLQCEGKGTDLLISMTKAVGADTYMCGGGAEGYQEDEKFKEAGIKLMYQKFQHPAYQQINTKEFVSGLSVIDVLFNCGVNATRKLLDPDCGE